MSDPLAHRRDTVRIAPRWLSAIDRVLSLGIQISPAAKSNAINKVLETLASFVCPIATRASGQRSDCGADCGTTCLEGSQTFVAGGANYRTNGTSWWVGNIIPRKNSPTIIEIRTRNNHLRIRPQ